MDQTSNIIRIRRGLTLPLLLLVVWEASGRLGLVDVRFLPPIEDVILTAKHEIIDNGLVGQLGSSLLRNIAGFLIGPRSASASGRCWRRSGSPIEL